jgi:cytochrome c biogenesis protein CcdA
MKKKKESFYPKKKKKNMFVFLIYFIFGLYFINSTFGFFIIPEFILNFDKWIILIGGILIVFAGINYLISGKKVKLNKLDKILEKI